MPIPASRGRWGVVPDHHQHLQRCETDPSACSSVSMKNRGTGAQKGPQLSPGEARAEQEAEHSCPGFQTSLVLLHQRNHPGRFKNYQCPGSSPGQGSQGLISFPSDSAVKHLPANAEDMGSIPGSRRSPGGGNGNPLQYSCLENPLHEGTWQTPVYGVTRRQT